MAKQLSLSEKVLRFLVRKYHEKPSESFDFEVIAQEFNRYAKEEIEGACKMLAS